MFGNRLLKKIEKLEIYDLSFFTSKRYFSNDGSQNCLTVQAIFDSFAMPAGRLQRIIVFLQN